jgi:hypothetical protein
LPGAYHFVASPQIPQIKIAAEDAETAADERRHHVFGDADQSDGALGGNPAHSLSLPNGRVNPP